MIAPGRALRGSHPPAAELRVLSLPPLALQAGHGGEVVPLDEHVARTDRLSEADDGEVVRPSATPPADPARAPAVDALGAEPQRPLGQAHGERHPVAVPIEPALGDGEAGGCIPDDEQPFPGRGWSIRRASRAHRSARRRFISPMNSGDLGRMGKLGPHSPGSEREPFPSRRGESRRADRGMVHERRSVVGCSYVRPSQSRHLSAGWFQEYQG